MINHSPQIEEQESPLPPTVSIRHLVAFFLDLKGLEESRVDFQVQRFHHTEPVLELHGESLDQ